MKLGQGVNDSLKLQWLWRQTGSPENSIQDGDRIHLLLVSWRKHHCIIASQDDCRSQNVIGEGRAFKELQVGRDKLQGFFCEKPLTENTGIIWMKTPMSADHENKTVVRRRLQHEEMLSLIADTNQISCLLEKQSGLTIADQGSITQLPKIPVTTGEEVSKTISVLKDQELRVTNHEFFRVAKSTQ